MNKNLHGVLLVLVVIAVFGVWGIKHLLTESAGGEPPGDSFMAGTAAETPEKMMASVRAQIEALRQRVEDNPHDPDLLTALGNIYFDAGMAEQALEYYNRVLALEPDNIDVMVDKATMLRAVGQSAAAVRILADVVAAHPGHEQALFNMGVIYSTDLGDTTAAVGAWKLFLEAHPDAPHADAVRQEIQRLESETSNR